MTKLTDIDISKLFTLEADDLIHAVDVSDTTSDPAGTSKKIRAEDAKSYINDYEILETVVLAGGEIKQDFILPGGYSSIQIRASAIKTASGTTSLYCRTSADGGLTFDSTVNDYQYGHFRWGGGSTTLYESSTNTFLELTRSSLTEGNVGFVIDILAYNNDSAYTQLLYKCAWTTTGGASKQSNSGGGQRVANQVDNAIRFYPSSGTFSAGTTFQLIGIK